MGKWSEIKGLDTKQRAQLARILSKKGLTLKEIGKKIARSPSRVSEYLRGRYGENWNSKK
jgi:predicted transcriptional regulator